MVVVQHAGTGGASSGCPLSKEELTVTCLAPLPLKLQLSLEVIGGRWRSFEVIGDHWRSTQVNPMPAKMIKEAL